MKRLWLVLLSLAVIAAFITQASAVDVKFSGEYYAAGLYLDKTSFKKGTATDGPSTAFYFQRLRLKTDFIVSPGLSLTTRADIMERAWGAARSAPGAALDTLSAGTRSENENIAFDLAYVTYVSPIGMFTAGYQIDGAWGTVFGDNSIPLGKVGYLIKVGELYAGIQSGKHNDGERSRTAINSTNVADADESFVTVFALYAWKDGQAGVLNKYIRNAGNRNLGIPGSDAGFTTSIDVVIPYLKAKIGPVSLQTEVYYLFGQLMKWDGAPPLGNQQDTRLDQLAAWADATADFGMFYVGGSLAYVSGDDPGTGQVEGSNLTGVGLTGGRDWSPCLLLFNYDLNYWTGGQQGYNGAVNSSPMMNAWFGQLRGGVKPTDKIDIMASVSYATADKKPAAAWLYNDYGYEIDLTGTYKITNNLSYTLGGAYLFSGKYFKGVSDANEINNNYMVINKLTLTF